MELINIYCFYIYKLRVHHHSGRNHEAEMNRPTYTMIPKIYNFKDWDFGLYKNYTVHNKWKVREPILYCAVSG